LASRMRRPETVKIDISQGDWLLVKKHLTAGEKRGLLGRMMGLGVRADQLDPTRVGLAKITTYLLDWSFDDMKGERLVIADQPLAVVEAALDAIDPESFTEVLKAIEAHDAAMEKARAEEKNVQGGGSESSAISASAA
jgi:hypothetical protein